MHVLLKFIQFQWESLPGNAASRSNGNPCISYGNPVNPLGILPGSQISRPNKKPYISYWNPSNSQWDARNSFGNLSQATQLANPIAILTCPLESIQFPWGCSQFLRFPCEAAKLADPMKIRTYLIGIHTFLIGIHTIPMGIFAKQPS